MKTSHKANKWAKMGKYRLRYKKNESFCKNNGEFSHSEIIHYCDDFDTKEQALAYQKELSENFGADANKNGFYDFQIENT